MTSEDADKAQQWAGMNGSAAWHLIERHADVWEDIAMMMDAWLRANVLAEREACGEIASAATEAGTDAADVLQPHQQRVVTEKIELEEKAKALSNFIGTNPIFDTLDPAEQERLKEQNDVMWQYFEILEARIAAFVA